jgi:multiple sugar transport system substrate-binding protein
MAVGVAAVMVTLGVAPTAFASPRSAASSLPTAKPGVITEQDYYTVGDNTEMVAFVKQFEKQNPGFTVSRDVFPSGSAASQTLTEASAHQLPDLLMMDNPVMPELAAAGDLVPLASLGVTTSGLTEGAVAAGSYKGVQYGLGFGNNSIALFYNKKLLAASHVTPPTTWAQLLTDAKTLTKNGVAGFEVAADNVPGSAVWQFLPFFWTAGGDLEHVNNAGGIKALTLYQELAKEGALPTSVVDEQQNNTAVDFEGGKAAMIIMGPWELGPFNSTKGLSYGIVPVPVPSAGMSAICPLGGEVWVIPKSTPANEALGLKLLKFLTSPASTFSWASQNGEIASEKSVSAELLAKVPQDRIFAQEIEHAQSRTGEVGLAYSAIETALGTAVQAVILGKATPTAALNTAQAAVKTALAQYHIGS